MEDRALTTGYYLGWSMAAAGSLFLVRAPVFEALVFLATFSFSFNLVGPDLADFLLPPLLFAGLLFGHISLRWFRSPGHFQALVAALAISFAISNIVGAPEVRALVRLLSNIALFLFLGLYVNSRGRVRILFFGCLSGVVVGLAVGALGRGGVLTVPDLFFPPDRDPRFSGLMGDPNVLCLFLVVLFLWMVDETVEPKLWRHGRPLKLALMIVLLMGIAASFSRAGWLGLGLALSSYGWIALRRRGLLRALKMTGYLSVAVFSVGLALSSMGYSEQVRERFAIRTAAQVDPGTAMRLSFHFTKRAVSVARENPWGVGTGRTERLLATDLGSLGAHNTFVQVLSDNGWFSGALFIVIALLVAYEVYGRSKRASASCFGLSFSMIFAALISVGAVASFHDILSWPIAWLPLSLAAVTLWPGKSGGDRANFTEGAIAEDLAD